jgi:hypothetical protein
MLAASLCLTSCVREQAKSSILYGKRQGACEPNWADLTTLQAIQPEPDSFRNDQRCTRKLSHSLTLSVRTAWQVLRPAQATRPMGGYARGNCRPWVLRTRLTNSQPGMSTGPTGWCQCPGSNAMHVIQAKGAFHFFQANGDKLQVFRVAMSLLMAGLGLDMH